MPWYQRARLRIISPTRWLSTWAASTRSPVEARPFVEGSFSEVTVVRGRSAKGGRVGRHPHGGEDGLLLSSRGSRSRGTCRGPCPEAAPGPKGQEARCWPCSRPSPRCRTKQPGRRRWRRGRIRGPCAEPPGSLPNRTCLEQACRFLRIFERVERSPAQGKSPPSAASSPSSDGPASPGRDRRSPLADAMLLQTKVLGSLVSHLVAQADSGEVGLGALGSAALGSRGAGKREKLQEQLAAGTSCCRSASKP